MNLFTELKLPNGSAIPNRIAKAAMQNTAVSRSRMKFDEKLRHLIKLVLKYQFFW